MKSLRICHLISFADALDYIYIANSMNDKAYLIAEPRPANEEQEEDENEQQQEEEGEEEETEQQTAATEVEEDDDENNNSNNNNHYYNDGVDTDFASLAGSLSLAQSSSPTSLSSSNSGSNNSSPSSPLATAALAAAAASASVAAAAARITAKAAHRALATGAASSHRAIELIDGSAGSVTSHATSSSSSSGGITDNNYTNVAVGLGAMLLNDTLLLDANDTALSIFGEMVNGSGNASAAVNVTASKVAEDDFTQLLRMAVTSVLLGLMILVTIIGKSDMESSLGSNQTVDGPSRASVSVSFSVSGKAKA